MPSRGACSRTVIGVICISPRAPGRADRVGAEVRFLQGVREGERGIDLPAVDRGSISASGKRERGIGRRPVRRIVGHIQLGLRQAEVAREARQRRRIPSGRRSWPRGAALRWRGRRGRFRPARSATRTFSLSFRLRQSASLKSAAGDRGRAASCRAVRLASMPYSVSSSWAAPRSNSALLVPAGGSAARRGLPSNRRRCAIRGSARAMRPSARKQRSGSARNRPAARRQAPAIQSPSATHGPLPSLTVCAIASACGSLVLDVIAPRDALAPFGARLGAEAGVDAVEQLARTVGIVVDDPLRIAWRISPASCHRRSVRGRTRRGQSRRGS